MERKLFEQHMAKVPLAIRACKLGRLSLWQQKACETLADVICEATAYWAVRV